MYIRIARTLIEHSAKLQIAATLDAKSQKSAGHGCLAKALDSGSCVWVQPVAGVILLKCVVGQNTHSITLRATLTHMYK